MTDGTVHLGVRSRARLKLMACPRCDRVGGLSIREREVTLPSRLGSYSLAGVQLKLSARIENRPVLECDDCGRISVGDWEGDSVAFPDMKGGLCMTDNLLGRSIPERKAHAVAEIDRLQKHLAKLRRQLDGPRPQWNATDGLTLEAANVVVAFNVVSRDALYRFDQVAAR